MSIDRTSGVQLSGMGAGEKMNWKDTTPIRGLPRPFLCRGQQQVGAVGGRTEGLALTEMQGRETNRRFVTMTNYFPFILKSLLQLMGSFLFQISV